MQPSLLGRLKTSIQFLAILLAILRPGDEIGGLYIDEWVMLAAAAITVASAVDYFSRFAGSLVRAVSRVFLTGGSGLVGGALLDRPASSAATRSSRSPAPTPPPRPLVGARRARSCAATCSTRTRWPPACAAATSSTTSPAINTMCPNDPAELFHVNVRGAEIGGARRPRARACGAWSSPRRRRRSARSSGTVGSEDSPHRGWYLSVYERSKHEGEQAALAAGRRDGRRGRRRSTRPRSRAPAARAAPAGS